MCFVNRIGAAYGRVEYDHDTDNKNGEADIPAEKHRDDQCRCKDGKSCRQSALCEEQYTAQCSVFEVEPLFEIFVCRIHIQIVKNRHRGDRKDNHRYRQAEVELDETHAVHICLAGSRKKSYGAGLCRHYGERDGVPLSRFVCQKIVFYIFFTTGFPDSVNNYENEKKTHYQPVDTAHSQHQFRKWLLKFRVYEYLVSYKFYPRQYFPP